jgi:hypothetical protein
VDKQKILNDAVQELGQRLIKETAAFAEENGETMQALVEASKTEKGTPDPEKCITAVLPMVFVSMLASVPGTNDLRAILLGQLAGTAFQKSQELGGRQ